MIAATMIVYTNNFTAFEDPRKFNCFAGLAPFSYSSGFPLNNYLCPLQKKHHGNSEDV